MEISFCKITEKWLPWPCRDMFKCWLWKHGVSIDSKNIEISYNHYYHFYDIELFPEQQDKLEKLREQIQNLEGKNLFKLESLDSTWRWERNSENKNIQYWGIRFWIKAVDREQIK